MIILSTTDRETITVQKGIQRGRTSKKRAHCRHHVRLPKLDGSKAAEVKEHLITAEQLVKRSATDRWWTPTYTGVQYSTDNDRVGGSNADLLEKVDERHILKVCTLNINGLDDNKLELVLQFFVEEGIDILFLIDARLDIKGGRYTGKKVKKRLGVGTRTHTNPCILDYGTDSTGGFKRIGGFSSSSVLNGGQV